MNSLEILNKFSSKDEHGNRIWKESEILEAIDFALKNKKFDFTEAEYKLSMKGYSVIKTEVLQEMKDLIPEEDYKIEFDA